MTRIGLRAVVAALALMLCVSALPILAKSNANRISSISPIAAQRGELVTILGNGFGGTNVRISVAGVAAALVSSAGGHATFRVPQTAPFGPTTVTMRNPGGQAGSIAFEVLGAPAVFDGEIDVLADATAAVSSSIGSTARTIEVEGMTLDIPAGAVPEGTIITLTPLRSLVGSPFTGAPVGVKLEPSGLVLLRPATLTLPRPSGAGILVGFGFNGDGEGFRLVPHRVEAETVELKVWHFSGAGALTAGLDEIAAVLGYEPTPAHELAEQRIAAAKVDAQVNGSDPGKAISVALRDWRIGSVSNGLSIARTTTQLDFFELAFGEWQAWLAYLQEYRDSLADADSSFFDTASAFDRASATEAAGAVARRQLDRCLGPNLPSAAFRDVIRVASAVNIAALAIEDSGDWSDRPLPTGPNLPSACIDVEITVVDHAPAFARGRDNRFSVQARVRFWSGDPSTAIPLRYRLAGIATEVTSNGLFTHMRRPTALGTDELQLSVDLDTTGTDTILRTIFEQRHLTIPIRERLELHARRTGDATNFTETIGPVAAGGSVTLRIRLAGDNFAARPITLTHDGTGAVAATTTTDSSGQAFVTYTAPASATIELVSASVTDGGFTTGDAIVITTTQPLVVTVNPSFGFASPGGTAQFTASVAGTSDQRVIWSAGGGSISSTGLYTAGSTSGTFTVTATSVADGSSVGTGSVMVGAGTPLRLVAECVGADRPPVEFVDRVNFSVLNAVDLLDFTFTVTGGINPIIRHGLLPIQLQGFQPAFSPTGRQSATMTARDPATGESVSATWVWEFSYFYGWNPENPLAVGVRQLLVSGPCQAGFVYRG